MCDIIENQLTACNDGWISVVERLPEEYGEYFVVWKDNATKKSYIEISEYSDLEGWIGNIPQAGLLGYEITHWQPLPSLPQPYKEQ